MVLYKYLAPARLDVLEKRSIRFTQPAAFNDPFEFRPCIESAVAQGHLREYVEANFDQILKRELEQFPIFSQWLPDTEMMELLRPLKSRIPELFQLLEPRFLPGISSAIDGVFNQNVGVLCLSEVRDSILMWGHYTENHQGFVAGFDSSHPFFNKRKGPEDEFGFLRQVDYRRSRPRVTLSETSGVDWFQAKCSDWAYEKEWRIMRVLSEAQKRIDVAECPICLFDFPADALLEIIIGLKSSASLRLCLESLVSSFPRAQLLEARENPSEYALTIHAIQSCPRVLLNTPSSDSGST